MSETTIDAAATKFERTVIGLATFAGQHEGFGRFGDPYTPMDYDKPRWGYSHGKATGCPLPVSSLPNVQPIYRSDAGCLAFRLLHDGTHLRLGCDFGREGETRWAMAQLDILRGFDFERSPECRLLLGGMYGQTVYILVVESFPLGNEGLVRTAVTSSHAEASRQALRDTKSDTA